LLLLSSLRACGQFSHSFQILAAFECVVVDGVGNQRSYGGKFLFGFVAGIFAGIKSAACGCLVSQKRK
jgi:hypothetical protein